METALTDVALPHFAALTASLQDRAELAASGVGPDRRIALALHHAQSPGRSSPAGRPGQEGEQAQTLEQILELARGRSWNQVFRALKSQGLLEEQTLGQVVARWAEHERGGEALTRPRRTGLRFSPSPAPSRIG